MKNIAIAICLLGIASSAFAAGTEIIVPQGGFQGLENPVLTEAEYKESLRNGSKTSKKGSKEEKSSEITEKKVRFGSFKNTPNTYWNHGRVNFGVGNFGNGAAGMNKW